MRNFRSSPAQRRDHYQELTDKIIAALEAGYSAVATAVGQGLRRRRDGANERCHRPRYRRVKTRKCTDCPACVNKPRIPRQNRSDFGLKI